MSVAQVDPKHNVTGARQAYYDKISKKDMAPLWEVLRNVVTKEPKSKASAHVWKFDEVKAYARDHNVPYNPLHDRGYPSIGCMPCTSPVKAGEDPRSGRWRGTEKTE